MFSALCLRVPQRLSLPSVGLSAACFLCSYASVTPCPDSVTKWRGPSPWSYTVQHHVFLKFQSQFPIHFSVHRDFGTQSHWIKSSARLFQSPFAKHEEHHLLGWGSLPHPQTHDFWCWKGSVRPPEVLNKSSTNMVENAWYSMEQPKQNGTGRPSNLQDVLLPRRSRVWTCTSFAFPLLTILVQGLKKIQPCCS